MNCRLCLQTGVRSIYRTSSLPVFQNKIHPSCDLACAAATGTVELYACSHCGFVFNGAFDASIMQYDADYQNEQAHSPAFDYYLENVIDMLERRGMQNRRIAEIGCGKGTFLKKLWARGFDAIGFDTAYEGDDSRVHKEYFSERYAGMRLDLVILRHTLEHIEQPREFLENLARLLGPDTEIYIEVPSFEWIIRKKAFWDIFYEHCNYFSLQSLDALFDNAESGVLFGDQYLYVIARLGTLRAQPSAASEVRFDEMQALQSEIDAWKRFVSNTAGLVVWGAGAKGSTFVNITDPSMAYVRAVVDMNARKAGGFIAKSGHPIITPDALAELPGSEIVVMNENYVDEIRQALRDMGQTRWRLHTLGLLAPN